MGAISTDWESTDLAFEAVKPQRAQSSLGGSLAKFMQIVYAENRGSRGDPLPVSRKLGVSGKLGWFFELVRFRRGG
jgi:hypothetical protein